MSRFRLINGVNGASLTIPQFTQKVIDTVAKVRTKGVVFLAWGTPAGKRVAKVDKKRHCILQSAHPSPLSASRGFVSIFLSLMSKIIRITDDDVAVRVWTLQKDE